MIRTPVDSSNVADVGYNAATKTLDVGFKHGGVYEYTGVPAQVHQELVNAESVGGYLAKNIKGTYPHKKVG